MSEHQENFRRRFIKQSAALGAATLTGMSGILTTLRAPAVIAADSVRPNAQWGIQIGDVVGERAIVWSRSDKPARMVVEWALNEAFSEAVAVRGPLALPDVGDLTSRVDLVGLPADREVFVRVTYESLDGGKARSEPILGQFRAAPRKRRDVRFLWSGDTAGQGWGINPDIGGMRCYRSMLATNADFFIHSGDTIYADGPMAEEVRDSSGTLIWRNAFLADVPEKLTVAQTLREFQRAHLYNRYDASVRDFSARIPQIWQWDDHEVTNNWSDSKVLDGRYTEPGINVQLLSARATKAFLDYAPMRWYSQVESERIYRHIPYGRDLDLLVVDMRSYRGPNSHNLQTQAGPETAFLGPVQVQWLKHKLEQSRSTWKVIAADMPIGLNVGDGTDAQNRARWEAIANNNGDGALGRELEIADLLRFIKRKGICNVVWLTADVHYCAAHYYDPNQAKFQEFDPFWEFVSGPLNAGSFGPNTLDPTFGPQVRFSKAPPAGQVNLPPSAGLQFFGQVDIDSRSKDMVVALKDIDGKEVFSQRLHAKPCASWERWDKDEG
jgi:alkaline phosphatase D